MPLKVLVDENLPLRLSSFLREHGFDAVDVREVGLRGATDEEILNWAKKRDVLILTEDLGFGSVIRLPGDHPGVMVVRGCSDFTINALMETVLKCIQAIRDMDRTGKIFVCEPGRVRVSCAFRSAPDPP